MRTLMPDTTSAACVFGAKRTYRAVRLQPLRSLMTQSGHTLGTGAHKHCFRKSLQSANVGL